MLWTSSAIRIFTIIETICLKVSWKSRFKSAKIPLPVDVRRSKSSLLNLLSNHPANGESCCVIHWIEIYLLTGLALSTRQTTGPSEVVYSKILNSDLNHQNWIAPHDQRHLIIREPQCTYLLFPPKLACQQGINFKISKCASYTRTLLLLFISIFFSTITPWIFVSK